MQHRKLREAKRGGFSAKSSVKVSSFSAVTLFLVLLLILLLLPTAFGSFVSVNQSSPSSFRANAKCPGIPFGSPSGPDFYSLSVNALTAGILGIFVYFLLKDWVRGGRTKRGKIRQAPQAAAVNIDKVNVTVLNLQIVYADGSSNGCLGPSLQSDEGGAARMRGGSEFTETITLRNETSSEHHITSVVILTPGFSVESLSPVPPITLRPKSPVRIKLSLRSPNVNYDGPLDIQVTTS